MGTIRVVFPHQNVDESLFRLRAIFFEMTTFRFSILLRHITISRSIPVSVRHYPILVFLWCFTYVLLISFFISVVVYFLHIVHMLTCIATKATLSTYHWLWKRFFICGKNICIQIKDGNKWNCPFRVTAPKSISLGGSRQSKMKQIKLKAGPQ